MAKNKKTGETNGEIIIRFHEGNTITMNVSENLTAERLISASELLNSIAEDFVNRCPEQLLKKNNEELF